MMGRHFSIILLPTNQCNVTCDYCFENKTRDRLTLDQLANLMEKVLDHMVRCDIGSLTLYWQGGEVMTMSPHWFEQAHELIANAAQARGRRVHHSLQSNLIGYNSSWNRVIADMFGNSVGTSMDYPNLHRKRFGRGPDDYTRLWYRNVLLAREAGIDVSVIAVPNHGTLRVGAERFYSYFVDELDITNFQVNTPFPGGEENDVKKSLPLDLDALSRFFIDLTDVWIERGYHEGVRVGPIDELVRQFTSGDGCLPCIWQANCADQFVSIDARGFVAQCDCWVTSYPEYFFGNIFESDSFTDLLKNSPARKQFLARPTVTIQNDCLACDFLSVCHGGCPVRTYTFGGSLFEKDPYCQLYKALFRHVRDAAADLARDRASGVAPPKSLKPRGCGTTPGEGPRFQDPFLIQLDGVPLVSSPIAP
jgi:radical SAM protein with 4Fe4S-binding SPASM domain